MNIRADLSQRALADTGAMAWVDSPLAGVWRKMLDRDGGEVARATSLVRYAPDSRFDPHTHGGGEEFLVLEGVFSDEHGDYPRGFYVRNPPGSSHRPFSRDGCVILVKLCQMSADDQRRVVLDTLRAEWAAAAAGVETLPLHTHGKERVSLVRMAPGTRSLRQPFPGGEELYVLDGVLRDEQGVYPAGTWLRNPPASAHARWSEEGCRFYLKTGHLM